MKQSVQKWIGFFGKSMLWSVLLYVALMLVVNWDEVSNAVSGKNKITIVNNPQPGPQQPGANGRPSVVPERAGLIKHVITVVKTISGVSWHAAAI